MACIFNVQRILKGLYGFKLSHQSRYLVICLMFCLLIISCNRDDKPARPKPKVVGLLDDTRPTASKTWRWTCDNNINTCTFRFAINKQTSHTFGDSDLFNIQKTATKTITQSSENGTYYIHVQAENINGRSEVAKASAILRFTDTSSQLEVTGLGPNDTTPKSFKTWTWGCTNNSGTCTYRHVINKSATHAFTDNDPFNATTTADKVLTASSDNGTYYIHVQAKDDNGNSPIAKASAILQFTATSSLEVSGLPTTPDTVPKVSKTWTWGCANNSGTCTYRHAINKDANHTFTSEPFNATITAAKTLTASSEDGTYYLHVQAKDSNGTSEVARTSAVLKFVPPLTLKSPKPHKNPLQLYTELRPLFEVNGISNGKWVALYEGSSCQNKLSNDGTVINGKAELKPMQNLHYRTYGIYVGVKDSQSDTTVDCQTQGVQYIAYRPLALSSGFGCYLFNHGKVVCWGENGFGELGQDGQGSGKNIGKVTTENNTDKPMSALKGKFINLGTNRLTIAIVAGSNHVCALLDNGTVKCWGFNREGQLGQGNTTNIGKESNDMASLQSIDLGTGRKAKLITAGYNHSCALLDNDTVKCWGSNDHGELGQNHTNRIGAGPNQMGDSLTAIDFGCRTNTSPCPNTDKLKPLLIASGLFHNCALFQDQASMKCWGYNEEGQLGQNNRTTRGGDITTNHNIGDHSSRSLANAPLINLGLGTNQKIQAVFAGGNVSCILSSDDQVKCWGDNQYGQLGQNDTENHGSASDGGGSNTGQNGICNGTGNDAKVDDEICTVAGLPFIDLGNASVSVKHKAQNVSVGSAVCIHLETDQVKCFGSNQYGQLGQNDTENHGSASDGGGSNRGQNGICNGAGNDAKVDSEVCTVAGLAPVDLGCHTSVASCPTNRVLKATHIITGGEQTCTVLKTAQNEDLADLLKCWGLNDHGQLGQNDTQQRGHNTTHPVSNIPAINFASFRICPLNKPYPDHSPLNGQCLPSCGKACSLQAGNGECQSGNACDDTTNYTITTLTSYDQNKCCLRVRK